MTLSIRDPQVDRMARELAQRSGQSITAVVRAALETYAGLPADRDLAVRQRRRALHELKARIAAVPPVDPRGAEAIMRDLYDDHGSPK